MILSRETILNSKTLKTEKVPVPEWGGEGAEVIIKELTSDEANALGKRAQDDTETNAMALWVVNGVVDEDGNRLFTEEHVAALGKLSAAAVLRVGGAMIKLCGFGDDKAVAKN